MQRYFFFILGLFAFGFIAFRAFSVGITFDEAWTLGDFVPQGWWQLITYASPDANHHLLNTLLIKVVHLLHGKLLFWERLPNVLAGATYIYFAYLISFKLLREYYAYVLFILLLVNPFVLDFFSLARGYGLALAFESGAVYFLLRFVARKEQRDGVFAVLMGAFAVLSNFSFLTFFIALILGLYAVYFTVVRDGKPLAFLVKTVGCCLALLIVVYRPIIKLAEGGMLYYGGTSGFYKDTVLTLLTHSMYEPNKTVNTNAFMFPFFVGFAAILLMATLDFLRGKASQPRMAVLALMLLLLPISGILIQARMLGGLFPHDRAVLYLLPLVFIALVFIANSIQTRTLQYAGKGILAMVVLMCILNFAATANSYKTVTWFFDAHTKTVLDKLEALAERNGEIVQLSSSWPFKQSVGYYLKKEKSTSVHYQDQLHGRTDDNTDFYLYLDSPLKIVEYNPGEEAVHQLRKDTVLAFPEESVFLFSIRHPDTLQTRY